MWKVAVSEVRMLAKRTLSEISVVDFSVVFE